MIELDKGALRDVAVLLCTMAGLDARRYWDLFLPDAEHLIAAYHRALPAG